MRAMSWYLRKASRVNAEQIYLLPLVTLESRRDIGGGAGHRISERSQIYLCARAAFVKPKSRLGVARVWAGAF